jgi:hypothetical protein
MSCFIVNKNYFPAEWSDTSQRCSKGKSQKTDNTYPLKVFKVWDYNDGLRIPLKVKI